jgi:hypothetical protein
VKTLILVAIMFLGSAIQGATGFGFGLFAVAAMSLFESLTVTTPLLAVLNVPVTIYVFWKLRHSVVWSRLAVIIAATLVGIPIGVFVLVNWPQALLMRVLGVVLILAGLRSAVATRNGNAPRAEACPESRWPDVVLQLLVGLSVGALGGAFNTGGPPIIAYMYCRPWSKEERTAGLQAVFVINLAMRIVTMSCAGLYNVALLKTAAICLPGAVLGMFVGHALFRRVPARGLELFVVVFLLAIGLKLIIFPGG